MRKLYLLRHADATKDIGAPDINRQITEKGKEELIALSAELTKLDFSCEFAMCSTANRTRQTIQFLKDTNHYNFGIQYAPELYNATLDQFIDVVRSAKNIYSKILIVGHNPAISEFGNYIRRGLPDFVSTAQMKAYELDIEKWSDLDAKCGDLIWSMPK